jgi:hypothetical protein
VQRCQAENVEISPPVAQDIKSGVIRLLKEWGKKEETTQSKVQSILNYLSQFC